MAKRTSPGWLAKRILDILKENPEGLDIYQLREKIPESKEGQEQFGRRLRELDPFYVIKRVRRGRMTVYKYVKPRPVGDWEFQKIDKTLRAKILNKAGGRCQMCGQTVEDDLIRLHVDHKIPESWGGKTAEDNLWVVCSTCNEGKKNYFATFDTGVMKEIMGIQSVHERIARLLKLRQGEWVDSELIEFIANAKGPQTDWRKRLRELRYPVIGLEIKTKRVYQENRASSQYKLTRWVDLPEDPTAVSRKYEIERAKKNKQKI